MDLCLRFTPPIFRSELWAGQSVTFTSPGTATQTQICWWLLEVFFQNILIFHDSFYFDKSPRYRYTKASPQHNPPTIAFHFMLHASAFFFQTSPRPNSYSFVLCDQMTRFKYVQVVLHTSVWHECVSSSEVEFFLFWNLQSILCRVYGTVYFKKSSVLQLF